jgi:hypothetical protein
MAKEMNWVMFAALIIVGIVAFNSFIGNRGTTTTPQSGTEYISTGSTTLSFVSTDALQPGTTIGGTGWVGVNGGNLKSGVTAVNPIDNLEILFVNNTAYHNVYITGHSVPKAPTDPIGVAAKGNASISLTMFNTNNQVLDANGASTNQSVTTGGSYNMQIRMDGQDKKSTNDMVCILEASDGTKADKMTLNGFSASYKGMAKPSSYTLIGSTSAIWVYDVPAIEGAVSPTGTIGITSKTSQTLAGVQFKVTCRTKEYFIDSITGKVVYDIEDSAGTAKSMASYSFTDYFT